MSGFKVGDRARIFSGETLSGGPLPGAGREVQLVEFVPHHDSALGAGWWMTDPGYGGVWERYLEAVTPADSVPEPDSAPEVREAPAALLRRAADRLDNLRTAATPMPWTVTDLSARYGGIVGPARDETSTSEIEGYGGDLLAETVSPTNRALICALGLAAEPMADWLRWTGTQMRDLVSPYRIEGQPHDWYCDRCGNLLDDGCKCWTRALATARAVLGETDGGEAR